jgi:hypothetical protein
MLKQPLSPAAAAAWEAFNKTAERVGVFEDYGDALGAALRAVADQVVPQPPMIVEGGRIYEEAWTATVHDHVRRQFLAIAAELES